MRSLTVKVSQRLSARVARIAKSRHVSQSEVVRLALEGLAETEGDTVIDRVAHLVGAVKSLPKDLSTNPKHLRGFGE